MAYSDKVIDHYENPRNVGNYKLRLMKMALLEMLVSRHTDVVPPSLLVHSLQSGSKEKHWMKRSLLKIARLLKNLRYRQ